MYGCFLWFASKHPESKTVKLLQYLLFIHYYLLLKFKILFGKEQCLLEDRWYKSDPKFPTHWMQS